LHIIHPQNQLLVTLMENKIHTSGIVCLLKTAAQTKVIVHCWNRVVFFFKVT